MLFDHFFALAGLILPSLILSIRHGQKYGPELLRIRTLFRQCASLLKMN